MEIVWIVAIIGWLTCGGAGGAIISRYNKAGTGFFWGFLLGSIGLAIAWTISRKQGSRIERKCPFCAELILVDAKLCKHCRSKVESIKVF